MKTRKEHPREIEKAKRIARAQRFLALMENYTLDEIGNAEKPPISRQRVGQLIASLRK